MGCLIRAAVRKVGEIEKRTRRCDFHYLKFGIVTWILKRFNFFVIFSVDIPILRNE
jgi:hypothetical protein